MDNRINEMRRKISLLRANMLDIERSIRQQINDDLDCTSSSEQLMAMRVEMVGLLQQWKAAGGESRCPTVAERLKENYRPVAKRTEPPRGVATTRTSRI
jgi:hypothetical protein